MMIYGTAKRYFKYYDIILINTFLTISMYHLLNILKINAQDKYKKKKLESRLKQKLHTQKRHF